MHARSLRFKLCHYFWRGFASPGNEVASETIFKLAAERCGREQCGEGVTLDLGRLRKVLLLHRAQGIRHLIDVAHVLYGTHGYSLGHAAF